MSLSVVASSKLIATVPEFHPRYYVPETAQIEEQPVLLNETLLTELHRQDSCLDEDVARDVDECSTDGSLSNEEPHPRRSQSVISDASEEGHPDSGIENEKDPDMVVPDQDTIDRIVTQVEIYFSDANVLKDKFLLKHIRRNKEGYVSLKLVSSFKKVKQLTKDWRVVAHAISKASAGIQINDLGTKIRRIDPLPNIDDTPVTCTILALSLPLEKPSIDTVSQLFGKCGDIALIRVLRAGAPLTSDVKPLAAKYAALHDTHCAWVEFETPEAVKEACKLSSDEGMKVIPIVQDAAKKSAKAAQKSQTNSRKNSFNNNNNNNNVQHHNNNNTFYNNNFGQGSNNSFLNRSGPNSRKNSLKYNNNNNNHGFQHQNNGRMEQPQFQRNGGLQQRRKAVSLQHSERPNIRDLYVISENGRRRPKSKSCFEFPGPSMPSTSAGTSGQSWVQRHLFAAAVASATSAAGGSNVGTKPATSRPARVSLGTLTLPEGVARFPKGPDGTKGFGARKTSKVAV